MSESKENCVNCKRVKEHVATILSFQVLEKIVDKPLRIRGIAMCSGMSRNLNIYTAEELQAFSSKLVSAPVYIEHVAVPVQLVFIFQIAFTFFFKLTPSIEVVVWKKFSAVTTTTKACD